MKEFPIEVLNERIHLRFLRAPEAHWYYLADEDEIDWEKATHIHDAFDPDDPTHTPTHTLFRYKCSDGITRWLCTELEWEPEISAEDYAEWCAASCGMTYNAYIGKPWLD